MKQLADIHPSAPLFKGISYYDVKLVQRLLYYTRQDLWLSESGKEWHYPLLITLREKDRKNWRNRRIEAWEARWKKERNRKKGKGKTGQYRACPSVWDSSPSAWQAAAGAAWSASQWRGAEGADVTRERATSACDICR